MAGLSVYRNGQWQPVGGGEGGGPGYQRPYDWLPLPEVGPEDRIFAALVAVYPHESNYLSFLFRGAYEVDWGDGTVEQFADNVRADHIYDWDDLDASTYCHRGYRQAVVVVTPTTGTWSTINLNQRNPAYTYNNASNTLLDVVVAGDTLSSVTLSGTASRPRMMEQFRQVGGWSIAGTGFTNMFIECYSLQSVPELDTSSGTNFSNMFNSCFFLQSIPELDTSSGTNFTNMFNRCYSLQPIPELDTSSGTNFTNMFIECYSLQSVPELDTSSGTNFSNMFNSCFSLGDAPLQGTSANISYANTRLSREALVRVFNGLAEVDDATITITGTPGASQLDAGERAIATDKGWTIVG